MQKILLSFSFLFSVVMVFAQTEFSDDFESYNDGDLIGAASPNWTTWGNTPGGADDSEISSEEAYSGNLSLKMTSFTSTGGPADIVLPFGEKFTSGSFDFELWMFVVGGTGAYFNFQVEETVGEEWAAETVFNADGSLVVRSNETMPITGNFEHDKWFKVQWLLDLDNNKWELIVDGQCLGFFENNWNAVASLNIYPVSDNNTAIYFIDDVKYKHDPNGTTAVTLDAGIGNIDVKTKTISGTELPVLASVQNSGTDPITSFKILLESDGISKELEFSGVNIATGESYDFDTEETITAGDGTTDISLSILEVNGGMDERECNDVKSTSVTGITPAPNKRVLMEEATGTWCTFCPRGDVIIRSMTKDFPDHFVAIAVHGGPGVTSTRDPMNNVPHLQLITDIDEANFGGFPNILMDRTQWFSASTVDFVENKFFNQITQPADAVLEVGADYNETSGDLKVSTGIEFTAVDGNYNIDVILVESNINEDDPAYNQSNNFSGGAPGSMGGYENLPDPVPGKDMFYNHVSRGSLSGHQGVDLKNFNVGDRPVANFSLNVPDNYDAEELSLVAILRNEDGSINNTFEASLDEAIDFGFEESTITSTFEEVALEKARLFPNPANSRTHVKLDLAEATAVQIQVVNVQGQIVASRDYGQVSGLQLFPVDLGNMPNGLYEIRIQAGDVFKTKSLMVNN